MPGGSPRPPPTRKTSAGIRRLRTRHLAPRARTKAAALAEKELQPPADSPDQLVIGQRWFRQAEGEEDYVKARILLRAEHWFQRVLPTLSGDVKTTTEAYVQQITQFASLLKAEPLGEIELRDL